jgi:hypothetical protein
MRLSFTKQIKYFEHSHSSFQIFHIITTYNVILKTIQYMPLPFTKQMKDFHYEKIDVLQLGL